MKKLKDGKYMQKRTKGQIVWSVILFVISVVACTISIINLVIHYS